MVHNTIDGKAFADIRFGAEQAAKDEDIVILVRHLQGAIENDEPATICGAKALGMTNELLRRLEGR